MKITHVCLAASYCEGYTYQENLLSKYHRKMGYDVDLIASRQSFGSDGRPCLLPGAEEYVNADGIHVTRLDYASPERASRLFRKCVGLYEELERSLPDVIFVHGVQSVENATLARYVREHPGTRMFMDNHADYSNSATNWLSKNVLHRVVWHHYARVAEPYVEKFWGVTPGRVDFLVENYGLPRERCGLLVMGADDEEVERALAPGNRERVREGFGFSPNDLVVVTGGKIDGAKRQTFLLMEAIASMGANMRLLIFGPVVPEMRGQFEARLDPLCMVHVPWADSSRAYDYLAAADIVCFPGRHSVYWEQAAGMGKPLVVKEWEGTRHVDCGGNSAFLIRDTAEEIREVLASIVSDSGHLTAMTRKALDASKFFCYSRIASKSIAV